MTNTTTALQALRTIAELPLPEQDNMVSANMRAIAIAALAAPAPALDAPAVKLDDSEQYRMQMAAISTAALGYWTEADGIQPEYDTVPLRDVAKLYAKYAALHEAARASQPTPALDAAEPFLFVDVDEWLAGTEPNLCIVSPAEKGTHEGPLLPLFGRTTE